MSIERTLIGCTSFPPPPLRQQPLEVALCCGINADVRNFRCRKIPKGAAWSGMLECPCTTRAIKSFEYELRATNDPGCTYNSSLTSAAECFAGAATAVKSNTLKNTTVADATKPSGCTVADDGATVFFNTASPPAPAAATPSCASKSGKGGCVCRGMNGWIDHGRGKVRFEPNCKVNV